MSTSVIALTLCSATLLAHGWCLTDGTVLDDHWHQKGLREHGWSPGELLKTLSIEPAVWMHHWWQDKRVRWEYARPLFIVTMKFVYRVIGGENPLALHAYSLLLHVACVLMVWRLALLVTENQRWSVIAGLVFAVYPHAVMTVQWNSSQNCVQQTALTLVAMLLFLRAARLPIAAMPGSPTKVVGAVRNGANNALLVLSVLVWLAGVFTKENAIVLPAILLALDFTFAGRSAALRRWPVYATFGVLGSAYLLWRASVLEVGMPEVYIRRPSGDLGEYSAWLAAKLLHYLCTSIWPAPMTIGPSGRYNPWLESPTDCVLVSGIVVGLLFAYLRATHGVRGRWIWPLWIFLAVLPVTPVMATAHSGYFGGVGFAIALVLGPAAWAARRKQQPVSTRRGRWSGFVAIGTLAIYALLTMLNRWQWSGIIAAERLVPAWVSAAPPPRSATDVFFINLPFVNVYAAAALERSGVIDPSVARVHVLTYAPQPVLMEQRTIIEQIDNYTFAVEVEGQPYFSRLLGRFLVDGFRDGGAFREGEEFAAGDFSARIAAVDAEGVRRIEFRFAHALSDPRYCFYLTTLDCAAGRLRFRDLVLPSETSERAVAINDDAERRSIEDAAARLERGDASAARALFGAVGGPDSVASQCAEASLRRVGGFIARATGAPLQKLLLGPAPVVDELAPPPRVRKPPPPPPPPALSAADWSRVREWWDRNVDQAALDELWANRDRFAALVKAREEVPHARQWAALLLRTDLYLTGPPFPGPRSRD